MLRIFALKVVYMMVALKLQFYTFESVMKESTFRSGDVKFSYSAQSHADSSLMC